MRRYTLTSNAVWARPGDPTTLVPGSTSTDPPPVDPPPVDPGGGGGTPPPVVQTGLFPALSRFPSLTLYPTSSNGLGAGE